MDDADEAVIKYATEVKTLMLLYRRVQERLDRCGLIEFNAQFQLVECLTAVMILPVIRVPAEPEPPQ